jgi:hypothetical protein
MAKAKEKLSAADNHQRLIQVRKLGSLGEFSQIAREENQKRLEEVDKTDKSRAAIVRQDLQRSRLMWANLRRQREAIQAQQEVVPEEEKREDGIYIMIFIVSVLADLISLMPIVGGAMAVFLIPVIWILYLVAGHFKKRWSIKASTNLVTQVAETVGVGINALPFYTVNAVVNYLMILNERRQKANALEE